jgi:hypothetical protein
MIWRMNNVERRGGGSKNKHLVLVMVRIKTSSWFFTTMRIVAQIVKMITFLLIVRSISKCVNPS